MQIFTILILVFIGVTILLAFYVFIKLQSKKLTYENQQFIIRSWNSILKEAKVNPNNAILDADKLLHHTIKLKGVEGTVGEQLKSAPSLFKDVNEVWKAHKVRNEIAHQIGKKVDLKEAKNILTIFKKALKDLGANL